MKLVAFLVALPLIAQAEPSRWEAGVGTSYLTSGDHTGFGAAASALWGPSRFFAVGALVDVGRLTASGTTFNGRRFEHTYSSSLLAAVVEARLPIGRVRPYVDLALGASVVEDLRSDNTQCRYESGLGAGVASGLKVDLGGGIAAGLRASARLPGGALTCGLASGPYGFSLAPLYGLSATADYRW